MPPAIVQMSCVRCASRKLKCDKGSPCSACQRAGVICEAVARSRLPRGRNGGRKPSNSSLKVRLRRLESLVESFMPDNEAQPEPGKVIDLRDQRSVSDKCGSCVMGRYMGGQFWNALSQEVQGISDILEDSSDEDEVAPLETDFYDNILQQSLFNLTFTTPGLFDTLPNALDHPPQAFADTLTSIFIVRVNPIVKILHAASIRDMMSNTSLSAQIIRKDPGGEGLKFAVYYSAVNAMDEQECIQQFQQSKADLMYRFRFALEVLLSKANFVTTDDIRLLQAFMIFLVAVRTTDNSRWPWTMAALAIRIARALMLHSEDACAAYSPYEAEVRRRLWTNIYVMDMQLAFDRAADPLIVDGTYTTMPPSNVDDISTGGGSYGFSESKSGLTDSSFAILQMEANLLSKKLNFITGVEPFQRIHDVEHYWQSRIESANEFKRKMHARFKKYMNASGPFNALMEQSLEVITGSMLIIAVRPLQYDPTVPALKIESWKILQIALGILEQWNRSNFEPALQGWKWYFWIQWHPLAVALAELCAKDHGPTADFAWPIVESVYDFASKFIADSDRGRLWRPISKLMRKARAQKHYFELERRKCQPPEVSPAKQIRTPQLITPTANVTSPGAMLFAMTEPYNVSDAYSHFTTNSDEFGSYNFDTSNFMEGSWPEEFAAEAWSEWTIFMDDFGNVSGDMSGIRA